MLLDDLSIQVTSDQYKLNLGGRWPCIEVQRISSTAELKYIATLVIFEPEEALGSKYIGRHNVCEKVLKLFQDKRAIAFKRYRYKTIVIQVMGMMMMFMSRAMMIVVMMGMS